MFVPFITNRKEKNLPLRKGGGGKGLGGTGQGRGGHGGKSSDSSRSGGSRSSSAGKPIATPISNVGPSPIVYGNGGGKATIIPAGQPFAGRTSGGATRAQVYGTRQYGSGYSGITGRGVAGRGFPFVFWPLAWGGIGDGTAAYLHTTEYGRSDNNSRPGGIMMTAAFTSASQNTTLRIVADSDTVSELILDLVTNCNSSLSYPDTISATAFNDSLPAPKPEQVVQYYRASSVALSLDGYNDTAALEMYGTPDIPLPIAIDTTLLNCMNFTIGETVLLIGGTTLTTSPTSSTTGLFYLILGVLVALAVGLDHVYRVLSLLSSILSLLSNIMSSCRNLYNSYSTLEA